MNKTFDIDARRPWLLLGLLPLWLVIGWMLWRMPAVAAVVLVAGPLLSLLFFFRWRNTLTLTSDRLVIRAGGNALDVAFAEIDRGSVQLIDDDQDAESKLERRAGATLGAYRFGWYGAIGKATPRWFLASNGRQVLALSFGQGSTQVRVSLAHAGDREQVLAALRQTAST